jgi:hypothetical protein
MSADSFHALVEKQFKKARDIFNFDDYVRCIRGAGVGIEMCVGDFKCYKSGLSQGKVSRETMPLLDDAACVEIRKGCCKMFWKRRHEDHDFNPLTPVTI